MDIQFRGNTLSGDPAKHISYAVFINQQNKTLYLIFDSSRRKNSPEMAYLCRILTVFVLHRYYVIYCLCFVSLMIFLMLLFVMI